MRKFTGRIRASAAIKKAYYKKLMKLIDAMDNSVKWFLEAEYKKQEDKIINSDMSADRHERAERIPIGGKGSREGKPPKGFHPDIAMDNSVKWFLEAEYKKHEDKIISDVSVAEPRFGEENSIHRRVAREREPMKGSLTDISQESEIVASDSAAGNINDALKILFRRWSKKFDAAAEDIATWFADEAAKHSNRNLQSLLTQMGFTVKLNLTTTQKTKLKALILENVNLIKSIPQKYFTELTTVTMQSVSRGRDLDYLCKEIQKRYGVAKDRAVLIARDQNNKATSIIIHDKYEELGIKEAVWKHNSGAKDPRVSHLKADGKPYDINKGMFIDGKHIYPGEEINCGCTSVPIIPGLNGV